MCEHLEARVIAWEVIQGHKYLYMYCYACDKAWTETEPVVRREHEPE